MVQTIKEARQFFKKSWPLDYDATKTLRYITE